MTQWNYNINLFHTQKLSTRCYGFKLFQRRKQNIYPIFWHTDLCRYVRNNTFHVLLKHSVLRLLLEIHFKFKFILREQKNLVLSSIIHNPICTWHDFHKLTLPNIIIKQQFTLTYTNRYYICTRKIINYNKQRMGTCCYYYFIAPLHPPKKKSPFNASRTDVGWFERKIPLDEM